MDVRKEHGLNWILCKCFGAFILVLEWRSIDSMTQVAKGKYEMWMPRETVFFPEEECKVI